MIDGRKQKLSEPYIQDKGVGLRFGETGCHRRFPSEKITYHYFSKFA